MRKALYRKYRPTTFENFVGQKEIKETLINSIKTKKFSHAYLFSGPRGTGKTSAAKLLAKALNCENFDADICGKCGNCLKISDNSIDIIEIDAASNNGVDEIRELRSKINLVPTELRYKVYIIDEVHMLTTGAFNALLKTLEEPPQHVIFILATTELYKVPITIVSRCQTYNFKRITNEEIVDRLNYISTQEKINIESNVLEIIAEISNGGLRDAIGLLDKVSSIDKEIITLEDFENINGYIGKNDLKELYELILTFNDKLLLEKLEILSTSGKNITNLLTQLLFLMKNELFLDKTNKQTIVDVMYIINEVIMENDEKRTLLNFEVKILHYMQNKIISREIILEPEIIINSMVEKEEAVVINEPKKQLKVEIKEEIISREIILESEPVEEENTSNKLLMEELVAARINNVFASANKSALNSLKKQWELIKPLDFNTTRDRKIAFFTDGIPVAASSEYMIVKFDYPSLVDKCLDCLEHIEKKLSKEYEINQKLVPISNDEWHNQRNEYIKKTTEKYNYEIIDDKAIIKKIKEQEKKEPKKINDPIVKDLVNIVGLETIEFE